ncbi:MAG: dihydroneopterin aldolase [Bacillota bacterium]|nr:dihydroneopterin aldolase [Bacillota bacterium]
MGGEEGWLDRLSLRSMTFWGYTGVHAEEQERGQPFEVDLDLYLDLRQAARSDDLAATVDYSALFGLVRQVVEGRRFQLVEALAGAVAEAVLASASPVEAVTVRVRKPRAPLPGVFETVEVELRRSRTGEGPSEVRRA